MLTDRLVMIVEDNCYIAMNLAMAVEDLDGTVAGPVGSVEEAFNLLKDLPISAAVLDSQLSDRDVTPIALHLLGAAVPFVIHSGTGIPAELATTHPDIPVLMKPLHPEAVLAALVIEINGLQRS